MKLISTLVLLITTFTTFGSTLEETTMYSTSSAETFTVLPNQNVEGATMVVPSSSPSPSPSEGANGLDDEISTNPPQVYQAMVSNVVNHVSQVVTSFVPSSISSSPYPPAPVSSSSSSLPPPSATSIILSAITESSFREDFTTELPVGRID